MGSKKSRDCQFPLAMRFSSDEIIKIERDDIFELFYTLKVLVRVEGYMYCGVAAAWFPIDRR